MTDQEIIDFINVWRERHPQGQIQGQGEVERAIGDQDMLCYCVLTNNCIKFAYEFVAELTDGVFTVPHRCCIHFLDLSLTTQSLALLLHTTCPITATPDTLLSDSEKLAEMQ